MHGTFMAVYLSCVPAEGHALLQGSVIVGILFVTFISWIPGHAASWLGTKSQLLGRPASLLLSSMVVQVLPLLLALKGLLPLCALSSKKQLVHPPALLATQNVIPGARKYAAMFAGMMSRSEARPKLIPLCFA